ncbi:MAG: hypothetical protein HY884_03855 [Deltaproteobacteria bacterium]|nr:hypothetical protein [Deltaproteobacteria bacterium]
MAAVEEYIKTVNALIDRFEFLRASGVYFIAPPPSALQTSGNPAAGLAILCDEDVARDGATGKLLVGILNAMKFGMEDVFIISGVKSALSDKGGSTLLNELAKLTPKAIVAFGKASANALAGLAPSEAAPFSDWKRIKVLQAPCLKDMPENKDLKRKTWRDLQAVMKELGKAPG